MLLQKAGRSGNPNTLQQNASSSCEHGTPEGLPSGMPGSGELMDAAMQQAAQWGRQFMAIYEISNLIVYCDIAGKKW
jgi:hypothetical protein